MKWIKPGECESAHCLEIAPCEGGACVELCEDVPSGHVLIRATALGDAATYIKATREELAAFLIAAKAGQYDHLVQGV